MFLGVLLLDVDGVPQAVSSTLNNVKRVKIFYHIKNRLMRLSKKKKKSFRLPERYFLLLIGFQIMFQNRQSILNGLLADLVAVAFKAVHFCPDALFGGKTEPYCSDRIFFCRRRQGLPRL